MATLFSSVLTVMMMMVVGVFISPSSSLPFLVFHGLGDQCTNDGMSLFTQMLSNYSGQQGTCIEIGDGTKDSWFMPLSQQVELACEKIKSLPHLKDGFNMVGLSQGNLIGRGVIEWCDGAPPVHNMISLGGPHAGTASVPLCTMPLMCLLADWIMEMGIYTTFAQTHLAPAGYIKIPMDLSDYYKGCTFLTKLNNEIPESRNETYKSRFSSLNQLVLIMFEKDEVLVPRETAWFGYYSENSMTNLLPSQQTELYTEDWIGLKALDEAGKVTYQSFPGGHLHINETEVQLYLAPYLAPSISDLWNAHPNSY